MLALSPDGRRLAFVASGSGSGQQPYLRQMDALEAAPLAGTELAWNPRGKKLFYRAGSQKEKMMVVDYQTEPTFSADKLRLLFEGNYFANAPTSAGAFYSVSPDGQRFLMTQVPDQQQSSLTQVNMVRTGSRS